MRLAAVSIMGILAVLACAPAVDPQLPAGGVPVDDQERVLALQYSGVVTRERLVIRDAAAWEQLWNQAHRNVQPLPDVPSIDFSSNVVIAAAIGTRATGGYAVEVDVMNDGGSLQAVVTEQSPGRGCILTQALTAPVVAVRVKAAPASVAFIERKEVFPC